MPDDFETCLPARRFARLRGPVREAVERGRDLGDDSKGIEHRALLNAFHRGRAATTPSRIQERLFDTLEGLRDGTITPAEANAKNRRAGRRIGALKKDLQRRKMK